MVTTMAAGADRPGSSVVRVLPVPRLEPPTDEELRAAGLAAPVMSAPFLPLELPSGPALRRRRGPVTRRAPRPPDGEPPLDAESGSGELDQGAERTAASSPVRIATVRLVAACLEVTRGFRPVAHVRALCRPDRFDAIAQQIRFWSRPRRATAGFPIGWRPPTGSPPRDARAASRSPGDRVTLRRVRICEVADDVAEVAVVLSRRGYTWAVAVRMERRRDRWLCAHLEVI